MNSKIKIKGKLKKVSKEETRAVIEATICVFRFHNAMPKKTPTIVFVKDDSLGKVRKGDGKAIGRASYSKSRIQIEQGLKFSKFFTTFIHEYIHICYDWDDSECEKLTSTLTSKMKPDIEKIYNVLVENTYKRAGYIAHTKMAYKPKGDDYYDDAQWNRKAKSNGEKYRKDFESKVMRKRKEQIKRDDGGRVNSCMSCPYWNGEETCHMKDPIPVDANCYDGLICFSCGCGIPDHEQDTDDEGNTFCNDCFSDYQKEVSQ